MNKTVVFKLPELLSHTEKGRTYELEGWQCNGAIVGFRKKGSRNGNHWHSGNVAGKNPESFLLMSGKVLVEAMHLDTGERVEKEIEAPMLMEIYPRVHHIITVLEDCSFLELNSIEEHAEDTCYPEAAQKV